jgi:hypothetical protein
MICPLPLPFNYFPAPILYPSVIQWVVPTSPNGNNA